MQLCQQGFSDGLTQSCVKDCDCENTISLNRAVTSNAKKVFSNHRCTAKATPKPQDTHPIELMGGKLHPGLSCCTHSGVWSIRQCVYLKPHQLQKEARGQNPGRVRWKSKGEERAQLLAAIHSRRRYIGHGS